MGFIKNLKATIDSYPQHSGFLVAYSGGADSTALLHLVHALYANNIAIRAIHINHGIQADSDKWQAHCQLSCQQLGIPLIVEQAQLKDSSENSCRQARYGFFKQHLNKYEMLLTAHHAQDQAETILLKLLRGTGVKGLCGIDALKKFNHGFIARPLLTLQPQELQDYLHNKQIKWIEDDSNNDDSYKRNFIRNQIIPALQNTFPNAINNITRSANNSRQSLDLLQHLCDFQGKALPISKLQQLPQELQPTLLYHWLTHKNLPTADKVVLTQICHDFINAKVDRHPHYKNNYYQLFRWQDAIYCIKNFEVINPTASYNWDTSSNFTLPNGFGNLSYKGTGNPKLRVRFNQKGQRLTTHKHTFSKSIKQHYKDHNIPPWQKLLTPFIFLDSELVSLGYDWSHHNKIDTCIKLKFDEDMIL
jgi:tRNA(Ile)-lysidine synthase